MNTSLPLCGLMAVQLFLAGHSAAGEVEGLIAANVSMIGLIAKTHAVRHPTPGGFGNTLEFTFIRFLERDRAKGELAIHYKYDWDTALPEHLGQGNELRGAQTLIFSTPSAADRARGYQMSVAWLKVAAGDPQSGTSLREVNHVAERRATLAGQHFSVSLRPSPQGKYLVVDENGRLVRELNRRYAERSAECFIYEGCVVACLPSDQASPTERHSVDAQDLDQFVPDCYLIAALAAAVRRDPQQVRDLIAETPDGYLVTFPGQRPLAVPIDLDRGPDMVQTRPLDINSRGQVELWPVILERAFLVLRSRTKAGGTTPHQEFQDVCDGDAQSAYYILTGRHIREHRRSEYPSRGAQLQAIGQHLELAKPVMMSTGKWTQPGERPEWWREDHVYVIASIRANTMTLLDPGSGQFVERIKVGSWIDSTELKRFLFCE